LIRDKGISKDGCVAHRKNFTEEGNFKHQKLVKLFEDIFSYGMLIAYNHASYCNLIEAVKIANSPNVAEN
jgi:hypothetical protein